MPTKIHMEHLVDGQWIPTEVSTAEFAVVRNDKDNWKINYANAFIEFNDLGERGDSAFLEDVKTAIAQGKLGPAWNDFIECLSNGSLFAIITARGHESSAMRKGIEWIIDNVLTEEQLYSMYNHLMMYAYMRIKRGVNVKYDILEGKEPYSMANYRRDFNYLNCTNNDILICVFKLHYTIQIEF
jgi:hypothetical protein